MEEEIQRLEERCNNLMMEKFGRLVDFEAVQAHCVNIPVEEMKVRIMQKEYEHFMELKQWEERIVVLQHQLTKLTRENTSKLHQMNKFCLEKHQLETELESLTTEQVRLLATAVLTESQLGQNRCVGKEELIFFSRKGGSSKPPLKLTVAAVMPGSAKLTSLAIQGFSCKGLYLLFLSKYDCSNRYGIKTCK
uniref:Uncharacterized protein n=1 Tax=Malurus cyaneus samueli TaxID=2593467 RepID=A0A8C5UDM5_9PASS